MDGVENEPGSPVDQDAGLLPEHVAIPRWSPRMLYMVRKRQATSHTAAYQVTNTKRTAQVVFATLVCCLASGITAGFAALKPVLVSEGVYQELCSADNVANSVISPTNFTSGASKIPCAKQDLRLNLFFILTSIMSNVSTLFAGAMLDRFGRHTCYIASSVFLAIGCILMGSAFAIPSFDGFIPANLFLGLGGTFLFVSSFQLANAFPKCPGTVVALITGAFDASAAVFLFYRTAYEASRRSFSPAQFFFGYLTVPALILIAELTFMPVQAYHSVRELEQKIERANDGTLDVHDSDESISDDRELRRVRAIRTERRITLLAQMEGVFGNTAERQERAIVAAEHHAASGVWGALHGVPFRKQIISPWFILLLLLTILQMLRMNYFIATIRAQYRYMLNSEDEARGINHFFDAALPTAGIVLSPFLGLLLDNVSVATMFAVVTVFIIIIGILNSLPLLWAGYATVVAFVVFRPLYYSVMSDYATKVFGVATFGRIYGTVMCLSGLANFMQPSIDLLVHGPLAGNPIPINIFMAVAGTLLGSATIGFVAVNARVLRTKRWVEDAENEQATLIPTEDADE